MPKYAYYDHTQQQPTPVLGWFDTDILHYPNLPDKADLLEIISQGAWDNRFDATQYVQNGSLTTTGPNESLDSIKARRNQLLTAACQTYITGGYQSNALGSVHTYPSTTTDQANMQASVIASLLPNLPSNWTTPFWCLDTDGNWSMLPHTASQIQQVGSDGKITITNAQIKLAQLLAQVAGATNASQVNAISW